MNKEKISTVKLITDVLPESCVIYKESSLFLFYDNEDDFESDSPFSQQKYGEPFSEFIRRTVEELIIYEKKNDPFSTTEYNLAIASQNKKL